MGKRVHHSACCQEKDALFQLQPPRHGEHVPINLSKQPVNSMQRRKEKPKGTYYPGVEGMRKGAFIYLQDKISDDTRCTMAALDSLGSGEHRPWRGWHVLGEISDPPDPLGPLKPLVPVKRTMEPSPPEHPPKRRKGSGSSDSVAGTSPGGSTAEQADSSPLKRLQNTLPGWLR